MMVGEAVEEVIEKNLYVFLPALLVILVTACMTLAWKDNQISNLRRQPKAVLKKSRGSSTSTAFENSGLWKILC